MGSNATVFASQTMALPTQWFAVNAGKVLFDVYGMASAEVVSTSGQSCLLSALVQSYSSQGLLGWWNCANYINVAAVIQLALR